MTRFSSRSTALSAAQPRWSRPRWRLAGAALLAAGLAACGGGGGEADLAPVAASEVLYATGAIHGLGSIYVNGIRYDDSAATVRDEAGNRADSDALKLGMVVDVQAEPAVTAASGERTSRATQVRYRSEIEGPVSAVDAAGGVLTVLGQRVNVTSGTVYDDGLRGGLAQVRVGDILEIYGFQNPDGSYVATRLEREDADEDDRKLHGVVSQLDTAARSFRLGGLTVAYAGLVPPAGLADGARVRVELQAAPGAGGQWQAVRLDVAGATSGAPDGRSSAEVEGVVTAYTSAASFRVNGVAVDASGIGAPAGLGLGARVEVEGVLESGVLKAARIELDDDRDGGDGLEIHGAVQSVNATARTFVVRGITVAYAGARFEDGTAARLAAGVRVEVQGSLSADGHTLNATEVEFD